MRHILKKCLIVLCAAWLGLPVLAAAEQSVSCPEAGILLAVPDSFTLAPLPEEDPDLCLLLESRKMTVWLYVTFVGNVSSDSLPQVLTGDETDMGVRLLSGREVQYIAGTGEDFSYYTCCWMNGRDGVTLDFHYTGKTSKAMPVIEEILASLEWLD